MEAVLNNKIGLGGTQFRMSAVMLVGVAFLVGFLVLFLSYLALNGLPQFSRPRKSPSASISRQVPAEARLLRTLADRSRITLVTPSSALTVEVVNTPQSITQGLSGRESIGADGMLFVFSKQMLPRFWMKEMKFDLDMVWINQGKVQSITADVPAPDPSQPLNQLPTYGPSGSVDLVLEIPAGTAERFGLAPNQPVLIML